MAKAITPNIIELQELIPNKKYLTFFLMWIRNGQNASKAYKELHPNVTDHSARILGSSVLAKIDRKALLSAYGLDHQKYFTQLNEGLTATKLETDGRRTVERPDHLVRKHYHKVLGELLDIETKQPTGTTVNVQVNSFETMPDDELDAILEGAEDSL